MVLAHHTSFILNGKILYKHNKQLLHLPKTFSLLPSHFNTQVPKKLS